MLSIGAEIKRANIFNDMVRFYKQRSNIVHGTKKPKIEIADINTLQMYARDAIKRVAFLEIEKPELIDLLDKSIIDDTAAITLQEKVLQALSIWSDLSSLESLHGEKFDAIP